MSLWTLILSPQDQYPAILTKQALSMKDLFYDFQGNIYRYYGTRQAVPSGQDTFILPVQVANYSVEFGSSCPLTELAI